VTYGRHQKLLFLVNVVDSIEVFGLVCCYDEVAPDHAPLPHRNNRHHILLALIPGGNTTINSGLQEQHPERVLLVVVDTNHI
jgi:hypothetical protein